MFNIVKYTQKIKNGNKTGQWIPDLKNKINTLVSARYLYSNHSDRGTAIDENFELKGLSNIQSCVGMFRKQTELESIEANFENCINCQNMFYDCSSLKFVKLNLKNLSGDKNDFTPSSGVKNVFKNCSLIERFDGDLSSLKRCYSDSSSIGKIERYDAADELITDENWKSYHEGTGLFAHLPNLTHFNASLASLIDAPDIFVSGSSSNAESINKAGTLDKDSIRCIALTIKDWFGDDRQHRIRFKINTTIDEYPTSVFKSLIERIQNKGWDVEVFDKTGLTIISYEKSY